MWKHKRTISRVTRHLVSGIKDNARTLSTSSRITITTHMCTLWIALTTKYEAEIHFHLAKVCVSTPLTTITLSLFVPCATYARLGHCHFGPMENMEDAIMLSYRLNCTCFAIQDTRARKFLGCVNIPWIYLAGIGRLQGHNVWSYQNKIFTISATLSLFWLYLTIKRHMNNLYNYTVQKNHQKLTVRGGGWGWGVKPYGRPDCKRSFFRRLPLLALQNMALLQRWL